MKRSISFLLLGCAALLLASSARAQTGMGQQQLQASTVASEAAQGLDPSHADSLSLTTPQYSTEAAVDALFHRPGTTAGADMQEGKDLTKPSVAPESDDGFSDPTAYLEYKYTQIQDTRSFGPDGPQQTGIVGFDFESFFKTIAGFNFTYANTSLSDVGTPGFSNFTETSDSYFFSPYIAKNFMDWINVGSSFTYGRTDSYARAGVPLGLQTLEITQDSYNYSIFAGAAHTWDAFSFSSTPTYIYGYNHFSFDGTAPGVSGSTGVPDAKTLNQTFLWLNNFEYAVTDKLSLSVQANFTRILDGQSVPTTGVATPTGTAHQWMSFGGRADYSFNKDGTVFAAFEHDVFNVDYDDYRVRVGVNYNF